MSTATAGGTATTIVDTQKQDSTADSTGWRGWWVLRPAAAVAADRNRRITTLTVASGTWNHGGVNYTNNPTTEVYAVSQYFNYDELVDIIDRGLSRCWYEYWTPLSLITDFDMEASGTTSWTASSSSLSKVTTSGFRNAQALRVANSGANGYAQSVTINVPSPASYFLGAICNITVGTAILRPWDVTNSAAIAGEIESAEFGQQIRALQFTTPATARQIAVRLLGTGASDDIVWDNLVLHRIGQRQFLLPSWLRLRSQIVSVRQQVREGLAISSSGGSLASEDAYDWPTLDYDLEVDVTGTVDLRLHLWQNAGVYPIWIQGKRQYGATADDNTTDIVIDEDYAVAACKVEYYKALLDRPGPKSEEQQTAYARAIASFSALSRAENRELAKPLKGIW